MSEKALEMIWQALVKISEQGEAQQKTNEKILEKLDSISKQTPVTSTPSKKKVKKDANEVAIDEAETMIWSIVKKQDRKRWAKEWIKWEHTLATKQVKVPGTKTFKWSAIQARKRLKDWLQKEFAADRISSREMWLYDVDGKLLFMNW